MGRSRLFCHRYINRCDFGRCLSEICNITQRLKCSVNSFNRIFIPSGYARNCALYICFAIFIYFDIYCEQFGI